MIAQPPGLQTGAQCLPLGRLIGGIGQEVQYCLAIAALVSRNGASVVYRPLRPALERCRTMSPSGSSTQTLGTSATRICSAGGPRGSAHLVRRRKVRA